MLFFKNISFRSFIVHLLILLFFGVIFSPSIASDGTNEYKNRKVLYTEVVDSIDAYIANVQSLRSHLDNTRFIPDDLLLNLEMDESRIIDFVSNNIFFEQYPGLLKGVKGTLQSRSGNALDQAILLASLLNSSGWESRIVSGKLNETDALALIGEMVPVAIENDFGENNTIQIALDKYGIKPPASNSDSQSNDRQLLEEVKQTKVLLDKVLLENAIQLKPQKSDSILAKEASEYFWVEYRLGAGDKWLASHPAFGKSKIIPNLKPLEYFNDSVPDKYQHKIKVESFLKHRIGSKTKVIQLMKPWERPVANTDGIAITYSNMPNGLSLKNIDDLESIVKNTQFFTPMFNGSPAGDKVFDLNGRVVDSMAIKSDSFGASALFQTISDKSDKVIGAMGGLDTPADIKKTESSYSLISQWLEFTISAPNGKERKHRRYIYGPFTDEQDQNKRKLQLMTEHIFMTNTGRQSLDYMADRYLNYLIGHNTQLKTMLHYSLLKEDGTVLPKDSPSQDFELLSQFRLFNDMPTDKDWLTYRTEPGIIGFRKGHRDFEHHFFSVDIIHNKRQILERKTDGLYSNPSHEMEVGIWETVTERMPALVRGQREKHIDTFKIFEAAKEQKISLEYIQNEEDLKNKELTLGEQSKYFIRSDLDAGYSILVPSKKPENMALNGWWRINNNSGEVLGMTSDGRGAELVENLTLFINDYFALINGIQSLKDCNKHTDPAAKVCCLVEAHANNLTGGVVGGVATKPLSAVGSALFSISDFTIQNTRKDKKGFIPKINLCGQ